MGPSGSGKTSLSNQVFGNRGKIITATTRSKRPGEIDGEDYYFLSELSFLRSLRSNKFFESTKYDGNYYGILRRELVDKLKEEYTYAVVDIEGYKTLKEKFFVKAIVIDVPKNIVIDRIKKRNSTEEEKNARIKKYEEDVAFLEELKTNRSTIVLNGNLNIETLTTQLRKELFEK